MTYPQIFEQIGNGIILIFLVGIPFYAFLKKIPVYETFIEGAKEGIPTFMRIVPFMVAMIVAVSMLRAAGVFDLLSQWLTPILGKIGVPAEIVPIMLVRPFSGSAATGLAADVLRVHGGNTHLSHLAVMISSTAESTFYLIAVYFGVIGISKQRHALPASLLVDVVAMIVAVILGSLLLP